VTNGNNLKKGENILQVTKAEQYRTVAELFQKSQPDSVFYTLLTLAVIIVSSGLLINNSFIVIGGMLVAPVLTPVMLAALGLAVGQTKPVKDGALLIIRSSLLIVVGGLVMSFVFGSNQHNLFFENTMRTAILYFIVAIASGVAATLAWTRKEIIDAVTGTAIALSLVPPLVLIGIRLGNLDFELARYYFLVFLFNLLGTLVGSLVTFTMLKFYKSEQKVVQEVKEHTNQAE